MSPSPTSLRCQTTVQYCTPIETLLTIGGLHLLVTWTLVSVTLAQCCTHVFWLVFFIISTHTWAQQSLSGSKRAVLKSHKYSSTVLTGSPPDAKEMLGMSCDATTCPDSSTDRVSAVEVMVRLTLLPACSITGRSPKIRLMVFTTLRFRSAVLSPAASHTLLMHSLCRYKDHESEGDNRLWQ